jgi:hypothetical protein
VIRASAQITVRTNVQANNAVHAALASSLLQSDGDGQDAAHRSLPDANYPLGIPALDQLRRHQLPAIILGAVRSFIRVVMVDAKPIQALQRKVASCFRFMGADAQAVQNIVLVKSRSR